MATPNIVRRPSSELIEAVREGLPFDAFEDVREARPLDGDAAAAFQADPDSFDSRGVGDRWLAERRHCVLEVPSRVILEESNYLLDPAHPDFGRIQHETSRFVVDGRLVDADGGEAAR